LWKLEVLGIEPIRNENVREEIEALEKFFKNISIVNNRYQIRWLYRWDSPNLGDNFNVAFKRLQSQLDKLRSQNEFFERYNQYFSNLFDLGMIEEVSLATNNGLVHYLPHKGILDLLKSTPLRVVFDAASHAKGQFSLNDVMFKGTNFLANIITIFFNFQKSDVALIADIKKAFHQIALHPDDRDVTRFLWVKDPTKQLTRDNLIVYRFTCVPFGIVTSPFILAATLLYHFQKTDPSFYEKYSQHFYVDNLVTSVDSADEAIALYERANRIFAEVSMQLAQWGSNNPVVQQHFDKDMSLE
uniref:Reverse transcriptase domain-containing protein n=1 Tax=Brugia timori TaxID=42155 RepID=A0A0R3QIH7_9BILA